jgi:hypothetical protein
MIVQNIDQLKLGDTVRSTVFTWSQKYMMWEGYEEYNCTKIGTIVFLGECFFTTKIKKEDGEVVFLAVDPGGSGGVSIELIEPTDSTT